MGELPASERYDSQVLCTPAEVIDEMGPIINRSSSTIFPNDTRDQILGRWCKKESAKFYEFVEVMHSQLTGNLLTLAEEAVLYRVCIRVLKRAQANRTAKPGGVPQYTTLMETYQTEQDMLEHSIRVHFYGHSGDKLPPPDIPPSPILPYPASIFVDVNVFDEASVAIPGARIYVNNEWVSTTWKDGKVELQLDKLEDNAEPYGIKVSAIGYYDSVSQYVSDDTKLIFSMAPEP